MRRVEVKTTAVFTGIVSQPCGDMQSPDNIRLEAMLQNESNDGSRVFETVRMMPDVWLVNDLDRAAECLVAFFQNRGVFRNGNNDVDIAYHV